MYKNALADTSSHTKYNKKQVEEKSERIEDKMKLKEAKNVIERTGNLQNILHSFLTFIDRTFVLLENHVVLLPACFATFISFSFFLNFFFASQIQFFSLYLFLMLLFSPFSTSFMCFYLFFISNFF